MSTKTTNGKVVAEESRWPELFTQLQEDRTEFFMNSKLEPTLLIPGDGFRQEWPADSQRVQDLLTTMYYELTASILKSTERELLLSLIREECRRGGRRLTEDEAAGTEQDVIVQGIVALVNAAALAKQAGEADINPVFNGRTAILQKLLNGFQSDGVISAHEEIPIFTNIFARKLNRLIPVLRGYGIEVVMEHKEDGSYVSVRKLDSFQPEMPRQQAEAEADGSAKEPSGESSGRTHGPQTGSAAPDDTDGSFRSDPPSSKAAADGVTPTATNKKGGAK